ncbi:DUF4147 domain-containing protein [Haladaptatus sp. CMAA 1911]|uniref:DUF4147 domain-containing protein n=1 Tax=Haladaptatus sp. CMAA 1911 TaxID=3368987 RepID=UPI003754F1E1
MSSRRNRISTTQNVVSNSVSVVDGVLLIGDNKIDLEQYDEIIVLGGGNGSCPVAARVENIFQDRISKGLVTTDDPVSTDQITVRRDGHPIPCRQVSGTEVR